MSGTADNGSLRGPKDGYSAGTLLSKASSSLRRSPSKKKTPTSATPLPSSEGPFSEHTTTTTTTTSEGTISKRINPRPGFQRATTAPATSQAVHGHSHRRQSSLIKTADPLLQTMNSSNLATATPLTTSKSAEATPTTGVPGHLPVESDGKAAPYTAAYSGAQNPTGWYQHITETAQKRIATLDYIRKAHEGRQYWFNTMHFSKADLARLPSFVPARLSRRATNYLLLGLSVPAVLDVHPQPHPQSASSVHTANIHDFLRSLNTLLSEFETFQQLHPADGSNASSLTRARIPQMFKRTATSKPRRSSGAIASEIGMPMQQNAVSPSAPEKGHAASSSVDTTYTSTTFSSSAPTLITASPSSTIASATFPPSSSFPASSPYDSHANSTLLPNEGPYTHLLTPPLPFAPDFYTVFATLCDVLIDAYQRLIQLVNSPAVCSAGVGEIFMKADGRIRKIIVGGIVRDFEGAAREGARKEIMGVQRVVLGGLMAA